jgi:hypothetical protein
MNALIADFVAAGNGTAAAAATSSGRSSHTCRERLPDPRAAGCVGGHAADRPDRRNRDHWDSAQFQP